MVAAPHQSPATADNYDPVTEAQIRAELLLERRAAAEAGRAHAAAEAADLRRAQIVARIVELCGSQYAAARRIGIDQSRVNRLVRKARAAQAAAAADEGTAAS